MNGKHLQHWANVCDRHTAVVEFLDWLQRTHGIVLTRDYADPEAPFGIRQLIDDYFSVDAAALDRERRELLKAAGP